MNKDMIAYYKQRANEFEQIYNKPERQDDLAAAAKILQDIFSEKEVFEIACGTGYWTEKIASSAKAILATDINNAVIEIAKIKTYNNSNVSFKKANIYKLNNDVKHESLFAGFILSHIKLQELSNFIDVINRLVKHNGTVVFMDNNYVKGSNTPVSTTDAYGNTYQVRKLADGSEHSILKNFLSEDLLKKLIAGKSAKATFINLKYYWIMQYHTI